MAAPRRGYSGSIKLVSPSGETATVWLWGRYCRGGQWVHPGDDEKRAFGVGGRLGLTGI